MAAGIIATLFQGIYAFLQLYSILLIIRVLLTWFPNVDWMSQPFATLSQLTDPYLNLFRSLIPPLGGIDFSPILGFLVLQFLAQGVSQVAAQMAYSTF